jgi:MFS transporter, DHA3 family, macrolide efflux protein
MDERPTVHRIWIFGIIWLGQLVSTLGSSITGFALGIWVYQRTGSATQFSLIAFCGVLPSILFSPLAGALVDRWNHRWTMILSDFGGGLITLAIFLLLVTGRFEVWHIYVLSALSSTFSAFLGPAYIAATSLLLPKQHLGRAGGMVQMEQGIVQLAAPMLGGLLLEIIQLQGILLLDMAACLFALVILLSIHFPRASATPAREPNKGSLLHEIAYGWTYLTSQPGLLGLLMFFAVSNFLSGIVGILFGPLVLSFASPSVFGALLSIAGIGMLIGSLVMSVWGGPQRRMHAVFSVMLLSGLCVLITGSSPSILIIGIATFLAFVGDPVLNACTQVIFQEKVAPYVQGRVFALTGAIAGATLPLAYLVAGPLADYVFEPLMVPDGPLAGSVGQLIGVGPGRGIGLMFVVIGALTTIVTVVAYLYPRLRLVEDELPDAIPDDKVSGETEPVPRPLIAPQIEPVPRPLIAPQIAKIRGKYMFPELLQPESFGDLKDTDQRPFSEGNATEAARNGVPFTYKRSPYAGSRHGKEMNVSALSQMAKHWSAILADLAFLRTQYLQRYSLKHLKSLWDLWHFAHTATSIHAYLARRSQNPFKSGDLPPRIGGLFKAAQGLFMTSEHMIVVSGRPFDSVINVKEFIEYIEANEIFTMSSTNKVCSGPPHMVDEFIVVALNGQKITSTPYPNLESIIGDMDAFFDYGDKSIKLMLVQHLFGFQTVLLLNDLEKAMSSLCGPNNELRSILRPLTAEVDIQTVELALHLVIEKISAYNIDGRLNRLFATERTLPPTEDPTIDTILEAFKSKFEKINSQEGRLALQFLFYYLGLEREALLVFMLLQGEIARSLGRNDTIVLNGSHIAQVTPNNVSKIFSDWIGISICNYSTHALFQCDSLQIEVK